MRRGPLELRLPAMGIARRDPGASYEPPLLRPMPRGFRAEDFLAEGFDGYLSLTEAAAEMSMTEVEVVEMVARGQLEAHRDGGTLLVRPAIVSFLGVHDG